MVYLIPILVTIYGAIQYDINGRKGIGQIFCAVFLFVYLVALIGFRFEVGGDTLNYMGYYDWQDDLSDWTFSFKEQFQPLYSLLCAIAKTIHPDFYVFQLIHAVLFNSMLFYFIYKSTHYRFLALFFSLLVFYLYFSTEILRESLAVGVFLLNYRNLKDGRYLLYYLGVFISILFHLSALILVLLPFIKWVKLNWLYWIILFVTVLAMTQLQSFFALFDSYAQIANKIDAYNEAGFGGYLFSALNILRYMFFPLFLCFIAKKFFHERLQYENMLCILSIISVCSLFSFIIFNRFINYFLPFLVLSMTEILMQIIRRFHFKQYAMVFISFVLIVYGSYYIYLDMYIRWVPYYSIFNPVHVMTRDNFE